MCSEICSIKFNSLVDLPLRYSVEKKRSPLRKAKGGFANCSRVDVRCADKEIIPVPSLLPRLPVQLQLRDKYLRPLHDVQ
jgi:hypothetical protein